MKKLFDFNFENFSKDLRIKRAELNISMGEAAEQIGVSKATLSRMENGRIPELLHYAAACSWAGLDMNAYLIPIKHRRKKYSKSEQ